MITFLAIWFLFAVLAMGPPLFIFLYMKRKSTASWPTKIDYNYKPKVSIIIPTYNEAGIISLKLENSSRLTYPKDLFEVVVVDSNSTDDTVKIIKEFSEKQKNLNIKLIVESERKGKSHALNNALSQCNGEIIIVSDADCFWPSDILEKALPYLLTHQSALLADQKFFSIPSKLGSHEWKKATLNQPIICGLENLKRVQLFSLKAVLPLLRRKFWISLMLTVQVPMTAAP